MIRQAISCDICAAEKRQTNHWFVAYEQAGELRISGWNSRHRLRPGSKHLCGQTCLHKLVDEFMAKSIAVRAQRTVEEPEPELYTEPQSPVDANLTSPAAYAELESSARLITSSTPPALPAPRAPALPTPALRPQSEIVTMPVRPVSDDLAPKPSEPPRSTARNWRAEAWERERARELRAAGKHPDIAARRRSNA